MDMLLERPPEGLTLREKLELDRTSGTSDHLIDYMVELFSRTRTHQNNCYGINSHDKIEGEKSADRGSDDAAEDLNTEVEAVAQPTRRTRKDIPHGGYMKRPGTKRERRRRPYIKPDRSDASSFFELLRLIPDEEAATAYVEEMLWGDTPQCGHCGSDNVYLVQSGKPLPWRCRTCRKYFSVKTGTVMEKTMLPLQTWIMAIHLMFSTPKGMNAKQMSIILGISHRTAWFLCHRIREAMRQNNLRLGGIVQGDESFFGGKTTLMHTENKPRRQFNPETGKYYRSWKANKHTVFGLKDSRGKVLFFHVTNGTVEEIRDAIKRHVEGDATIWTDGARIYRALSALGYVHEWVDHSRGQYVRADGVTTNGVESAWVNLKRAYKGHFHYMSEQNLQRYLNEFAFRNNEAVGSGLVTIGKVFKGARGRRLTYKKLTRNTLHGPNPSHIETRQDDDDFPMALPMAA